MGNNTIMASMVKSPLGYNISWVYRIMVYDNGAIITVYMILFYMIQWYNGRMRMGI